MCPNLNIVITCNIIKHIYSYEDKNNHIGKHIIIISSQKIKHIGKNDYVN